MVFAHTCRLSLAQHRIHNRYCIFTLGLELGYLRCLYIYFRLFSQLLSQPYLNERNLQLNGSDLLEVFT